MAKTSLAKILESIFGGVVKMLTGKQFPMNMRAMHLVTKELLRDVVEQSHLMCRDDLLTALEDLVTRHCTTKMCLMPL